MISKKDTIKNKKEKELNKLKEEFKIYDDNLLNKNFLLIYSDMTNKQLSKLANPLKNNLNNLRGIEILFRKENFTHLVGIPRDGKKLGAKEFYVKLKENKIKREDYETSTFAKLKGEVFNKIPNIFKHMSIIGDYDYSKQCFEVDKILGSNKKIPDIVLGLKLDSVQHELNIIEKYYPASILKEVTDDCILDKSVRKILYVFKKSVNTKLYQELIFVHRKFTVDSIYNDKKIFNYCEDHLKDEIIKKIK